MRVRILIGRYRDMDATVIRQCQYPPHEAWDVKLPDGKIGMFFTKELYFYEN